MECVNRQYFVDTTGKARNNATTYSNFTITNLTVTSSLPDQFVEYNNNLYTIKSDNTLNSIPELFANWQ
jgi:hypothetical protein